MSPAGGGWDHAPGYYTVKLWLCPTCGVVWCAGLAPWCHHFAPDTEQTRMVPLPDWHPYAKEAVS